VVTLVLADQAPLVPASIDIPDVDEKEVWHWLAGKFKRFDHQLPQADGAQQFLASEIEGHVGDRLRGQHLIVRMEMDFNARRSILSLRPEVLPQLQSVSFTGNQALSSAQLSAVMNKVAENVDYTERSFTGLVEGNLREFYEERGLYRVQFTPGTPQFGAAGVAVSVAINEGAPYQLGNVEVVGDNLPAAAMLAVAKFPVGKLANGKVIRNSVWEAEKVVKRTGYFAATAAAERSYDDAGHILNLRLTVNKGPLFHVGEICFTGLTPELEARARATWTPKTGDPYDYGYWNDFVQAFSKVVDFSKFKKYEGVVKQGTGNYVMNYNLVFEAR
jgi:hypothetical protein